MSESSTIDRTSAETAAGRQQDAATAARERARRDRRRGRIAVWSAFGGVLLLAGGLFGFGYWATHRTPSYHVPEHVARQADGIVAGGHGATRVDVYVDYGCAACRTSVTSMLGTLDNAVAANQITLVYHPLALLDGASSTQYSTRAAASTACASDMGQFISYSNLLVASTPAAPVVKKTASPAPVRTPGLSDDQLIHLGGSAGMIDPKFAECVRAGTYDQWVANQDAMAAKAGITSTPTVAVNGASIAPTGAAPTLAELTAALAIR
jgi:protein-disulfide isomerase